MVIEAWVDSTRTERIRLINIVFVPGLFTTAVSWRTIKEKGVKWDIDKNIFKLGQKLLYNLREEHGQFIIEYYTEFPLESTSFQPEPLDTDEKATSPDQIFVSQKPPKVTATAEIWHQRLGHCGSEPLQYIESESVTVTHEPGPKTVDYKTCSKAKGKRIVSRQPV
jgi:hypothetical protein